MRLLITAIAMLCACADLRVKEGIYGTLDEARAAGAIADGWVPPGLPAGVGDLREGHLTGGRHWGVLAFPEKEAAAIRALTGPEITANPPACDPPGRLEWWPPLLRTPIDLERLRSTGFHVYPDRSHRVTFAINWGQGRAYYWRG